MAKCPNMYNVLCKAVNIHTRYYNDHDVAIQERSHVNFLEYTMLFAPVYCCPYICKATLAMYSFCVYSNYIGPFNK